MDRHQQRIEAVFLTECSPQTAYDWLSKHSQIDDKSPSWIGDNELLEYLLVRRKNPLIDLGIARFGNSPKAILRVFRRGSSGIRCAALSNACIGPNRFSFEGWLEEKDIKELICVGTKAELESLAKNRFLSDELLEQLIERKEVFEDLSDDQYFRMLYWLGSNPRMSAKYDERVMDGWAKHSHNRVFSSAWELARSLPPTKKNANMLYQLLQNTPLPTGYENPEEVLERWRIEEEPKKRSQKSAYVHREISFHLRARIADVIKADDKLLGSSDPALRYSFYRRFNAWEFENWPTFIENDDEFLFDAIVDNEELWQNEENRRLLSDLAWKVPDPTSSMEAPNLYNVVEDRMRRENSEWFADEDSQYSETLDSIVRRVEKKVDKVIYNFEASSYNDIQDNAGEDILVKVENLLARIENSGTKTRSEFKQELQSLRAELPRAIPQPTPCGYTRGPIWPWVIVIGFLILILLK